MLGRFSNVYIHYIHDEYFFTYSIMPWRIPSSIVA